jgi:hypothetical protein
VKLVVAGILGLGAAWLIPKGGGTPLDSTAPTPTPARGITAVEEPLSAVSPGVSFRTIDGVRVFLVRTGNAVSGFRGESTSATDGPVHWCRRNGWFEGDEPGPYYDEHGVVRRFSAPRDLDRISVIVAGGRVTILPHQIVLGSHALPTPIPIPPLVSAPPACAVNERVG